MMMVPVNNIRHASIGAVRILTDGIGIEDDVTNVGSSTEESRCMLFVFVVLDFNTVLIMVLFMVCILRYC